MSKQKKVLADKVALLKRQLRVAQTALENYSGVETGEVPSADQAERIKYQPYSFTVHFLRVKRLNKGRSPGMTALSVRRFGTEKEANQHGKRFVKIQGHKCFTVERVNQRANAWINWATGKTNPAL